MFHVNFSAKSFVNTTLLVGIYLCSFQVFAQKNTKNHKVGNRIDALILRNRRLTGEINALNQLLIKQSNQIISQEGITNYYKSMLKTSRDSTANITKAYAEYNQKAEAEITALKTAFADSMELFQEFKKLVYKERNKVVKDTNVVRVYTMPYDQVRVRVLRKILDEGIGLVIERNTDEGFLVSKVFKDRKTKGIFKKSLETRVDCDIKMVQHPYEDNKTLFYASTRVQEKSKRDSQFIELTDTKVIKDYQKKLLKFFDDFLVAN
ncbi:hypothetical protein EMA8858_03479 [Emticicia aquatica]|jgi:phage-related protein|uniref:Uncharacterized protein n=1 Tax=Emticicia aquatica TaxID=1681835 RepID=A0ABM9ATL8_9BACT|nr:hypothetical protein [Emticicia aquatica]CAH0997348.1 hypothetical protein EMA8858_03479 [Emticicia aquatica]